MTAPFCPECGPTCPLHSTTAFLDPLHDELDRLRTENAKLKREARLSDNTIHAYEWRIEQAEARVDQLTDQLTLANDTLRHRGNAVNATGHTNDQLRAKIAAIEALLVHLHTDLVYAGDIRAILADQEPRP